MEQLATMFEAVAALATRPSLMLGNEHKAEFGAHAIGAAMGVKDFLRELA